MSDVNILEREIAGLQRLLTLAWKDLANPSLSAPERRDALNQMKLCHAQLRLHMDAERERLERSDLRQPSLNIGSSRISN